MTMKKIFLILALVLLVMLPSCNLDLVKSEESINEHIYPYFSFELSDDLTYYIATVVPGAKLTELYIPGELHTEYGVMPIKAFGGFENPEDAVNLKTINLDSNIEIIAPDAFLYASNLQTINHSGSEEGGKWAALPELKKAGCHFAGWKAGDVFIWEKTEYGYVQKVFDIDPENSVAEPVFVELVKKNAVLPDCTEEGTIEHFYCEHCNGAFSDADGIFKIDNTAIAALGHKLAEKSAKEPTCQVEGRLAHYLCERCGLKFEDAEGTIPLLNEILPIVDHEEDGILYAEEDYHCYKCKWCREELNEEDHYYDDGVITKVPTDQEDGEKTYTCSVCDHKKTEIIADHPHVIGSDKRSCPATCTDSAYDEGTCTECGRFVKLYTDPKLGHDFTEVARIEPTCQTEGNKRYFHCNRCDLNFENKSDTEAIDSVVLPVVPHEYKSIYTIDGTAHWRECGTCDPAVAEVAKTEVAEHSYDREVAEDIFLVTNATCTDSAVYRKSCVCEASSSATFEYGAPLGHEYAKYLFEEVYKGSHWIVCTVCGEEEAGTRGIHSFDIVEGTYRICSSCGFKVQRSYGGVSADVQHAEPKGILKEISHVGNEFTFKLINDNPEYPVKSYKWEVNGIEAVGENGSTFSFEAPNKKAYTVRCIFSNENGTASLAATVYGGEQ